MSGEQPPGKVAARIGFSLRCDIGVTEKILPGDVEALLDVAQQLEQGGNLQVGKRLLAIVVEFDAEGRGIEVTIGTPFRLPGVPCPGPLVDQLENDPVARNQIMCADRSVRIGERAQRFSDRVIAGVMNDDEVRFPLVEVRRCQPAQGNPGRRRNGGACSEQKRGQQGNNRAQRITALGPVAVRAAGCLRPGESAPASPAASGLPAAWNSRPARACYAGGA